MAPGGCALAAGCGIGARARIARCVAHSVVSPADETTPRRDHREPGQEPPACAIWRIVQGKAVLERTAAMCVCSAAGMGAWACPASVLAQCGLAGRRVIRHVARLGGALPDDHLPDSGRQRWWARPVVSPGWERSGWEHHVAVADEPEVSWHGALCLLFCGAVAVLISQPHSTHWRGHFVCAPLWSAREMIKHVPTLGGVILLSGNGTSFNTCA